MDEEVNLETEFETDTISPRPRWMEIKFVSEETHYSS